MPNWCEDTITITGKEVDLIKFLNIGLKSACRLRIRGLKEGNFDTTRLTLRSWLPMPDTFSQYDTTNHPNGEGLTVGESCNGRRVDEALIEEYKTATKEQKEKYGAVGWYEYNCKTIGTKWDAGLDDIYIEHDIDDYWIITINLSTAWSPCIPWLRNIYKDYPNLHFYLDYEEYGMGFRGNVEAWAKENIFDEEYEEDKNS